MMPAATSAIEATLWVFLYPRIAVTEATRLVPRNTLDLDRRRPQYSRSTMEPCSVRLVIAPPHRLNRRADM